MEYELLRVGPEHVPYALRKHKGNRFRMQFRMEPRLHLEIATPTAKLDRHTRSFILEKEAWVLRHYRQFKPADSKRQHHRSIFREAVMLEGKLRKLKVYRRSQWQFKLDDEIFYMATPAPRSKRPELILHEGLRRLAKDKLRPLTAQWAKRAELDYNQLRIKNTRTRWGSCSGKRNLNLNWYLILLPPPLRDYVIYHELMHLIELNHSPRFWALVEREFPAHRALTQQLHTWQWILGVYDWDATALTSKQPSSTKTRRSSS